MKMTLKSSLVLATTLFSMLASPMARGAGWVSPIGFEDSENKWLNEAKAYDNSAKSYAEDHSARTNWGAFLVLNLPTNLYSGQLRVNADWRPASVDAVVVCSIPSVPKTRFQAVRTGVKRVFGRRDLRPW